MDSVEKRQKGRAGMNVEEYREMRLRVDWIDEEVQGSRVGVLGVNRTGRCREGYVGKISLPALSRSILIIYARV